MFFNPKAGEWVNKCIEWAFYVFIGLFPFVSYSEYLFHGTTSRAVNLVIFVEILAFGLCFLLFHKKNDFLLIKSPITGALMLLLLFSFVSALSGVDFWTSFWSKATRMTGLFYFLHLGLFYLLLNMIFRDDRVLRNFLRVFLIGAGIFSIGGLLSNDGLGLVFTEENLPGFTFGNSSFAAMYVYAAFMASIYFVFSSEKLSRKWWRFAIPVVFIINPYFLNINLWSGGINIFKNPLGLIGEAQASSFVMFVSVLLLLLAWLVSKIKREDVKKKVLWGSVIAGILVSVFSTYSFFSDEGYLRRAYLSQASNARPIVWELSKQSISDRPMLGWGIDNFDRSLEKNYDNRLLEQKNGAEPWFDRAHNIFIDQTVETGYIGLAIYIFVYLSIFGSMIYVILRSKEKKHQLLAVVVGVYFIGHIMELQTAFETTISYPAIAIMAALASTVFYKTYRLNNGERSEWQVPKVLQYSLGAVLILLFGTLFVTGTVPIVRAENANGAVHTTGSSDRRLPLYEKLFGSPVDTATFLWKTNNDFQRGISLKPEILENPEKRTGLVEELAVFTEEYRRYANAHPNDYRVRAGLAGVYIYERLFGIDHLNEAHQVLDDAIKLNPKIPQAYWMKSVAYLYQRKFALAREWAQKAYELNPGVEQSQKIINYIEKSIKTFPAIDFYTFGQI